MKSLYFIILSCVVFLLIGCTHHQRWEGVCRHKALYCALVVGEYYETRLAYGKTDKDGEYHTQAQVHMGDEWLWLKNKGSYCVIGDQDKFTILKYYKPKQTLSWFDLITK